MTSPPKDFERIVQSDRIDELLTILSGPAGLGLSLENRDSDPMPALLEGFQPGQPLLLDISTLGERIGKLRRGVGFRLVGQGQGGMIRTPVLKAVDIEDKEGRWWLRCPYPGYLEWQQRRDAFRAELRLGMQAAVAVYDRDRGVSGLGDLRDLSLTGCRVELEASGLTAGLDPDHRLALEMTFPDGSIFEVAARSPHQRVDAERGMVSVGFSFEDLNLEQERRLWFLVREVEREAARTAGGMRTDLAPSSLFRRLAPAPLRANPRSRFPVPVMAEKLAPCAGWLDNQILVLRQGQHIDGAQLSRQADRLIELWEEDREGLLFATRCLDREPLLVRHGLGVAVHLLDLARAENMPRALCKALAAAAMVHDLGKALLPPNLLALPVLDARQYSWLQGHVPLLMQRMDDCGWLTRPVLDAVVGDINERLDGSGYPRQRRGDDLSQLARLASVVDVVDIMSRQRPGRDPWSVTDIYAWLDRNGARFDRRWVNRYRDHFGIWPVGSLVRYPDGLIGRVAALDQRGLPSRLRLPAADGGWLEAEELANREEPEMSLAAPAD